MKAASGGAIGQSGEFSAQEVFMKKLLLSVLTVGALAAGGAAQAQDVLGGIAAQILGNIGIGNGNVFPGVGNGYPQGTYYPPGSVVIDSNGHPVVVGVNGVTAMAGGTVVDSADGGQVVLDSQGTYVDRYGRRIQVDVTGRHTPISQYGGIAAGRIGDRDGDGVQDRRDRYPDDPRYR
jgi:hypothetical protein